MTLRIHLVRHASHALLDKVLAGRMEGVSLSEAGRDEARRLATRLSGEGLDAIQTSPVQRARETASMIADEVRIPVTVNGSLAEVDFGAWTGRSFADLDADPAWRRWNAAREVARAPGGESMAEVAARMIHVVDGLRGELGSGTVALVSHCEPIRVLVLAALGLGPGAWSRLEIAPASLSTLVVDEEGVRVERINEAAR